MHAIPLMSTMAHPWWHHMHMDMSLTCHTLSGGRLGGGGVRAEHRGLRRGWAHMMRWHLSTEALREVGGFWFEVFMR